MVNCWPWIALYKLSHQITKWLFSEKIGHHADEPVVSETEKIEVVSTELLLARVSPAPFSGSFDWEYAPAYYK